MPSSPIEPPFISVRYRSLAKANAEVERLRRVIAAAYYDTDPTEILEREVTGSG